MTKLFTVAEVAKLSPEQAQSYRDSLGYCQDLKNSIDTATEKGREKGLQQRLQQGIQQAKLEIAKNMLKEEEPIEKIMKWTGLSLDTIKDLGR